MLAIERARETVQRAILAALGRPRNGHRAVRLVDLHAQRNLLLERAERARDRDAAGLDRHRDAGGDFDWLSSDSAHAITR